jgi:DNA processing protein
MDHLIVKANMPASKVASTLLNLEFEGLVKSLPGKLFKLIS